jgi:predicted enzyme related to lactoylglutathione lyase
LFQEAEPARGIQITILVDDIEEAIQRIQAAGGELLTEPFDVPGVELFARFRDTEGNIMQVNQDLAIKRLPQD